MNLDNGLSGSHPDYLLAFFCSVDASLDSCLAEKKSITVHYIL